MKEDSYVKKKKKKVVSFLSFTPIIILVLPLFLNKIGENYYFFENTSTYIKLFFSREKRETRLKNSHDYVKYTIAREKKKCYIGPSLCLKAEVGLVSAVWW